MIVLVCFAVDSKLTRFQLNRFFFSSHSRDIKVVDLMRCANKSRAEVSIYSEITRDTMQGENACAHRMTKQVNKNTFLFIYFYYFILFVSFSVLLQCASGERWFSTHTIFGKIVEITRARSRSQKNSFRGNANAKSKQSISSHSHRQTANARLMRSNRIIFAMTISNRFWISNELRFCIVAPIECAVNRTQQRNKKLCV